MADEKKLSEISYVSVAFDKQLAVQWILQLKTILWKCCVYLKHLRPEIAQDFKSMMLYLNMLVTFTSPNSWQVLKTPIYEPLKPAMNQLCTNVMSSLVNKGFYGNIQILLMKGLMRTKPSLKKASLTAIITISMRPVIYSQFNESTINMFLLHIFSIPALVYHLNHISPDSIHVFTNNNMLKKSIEVLILEQNSRILFNALEGNYALCLLANIVNLSHIEISNNLFKANVLDFVVSSMDFS